MHGKALRYLAVESTGSGVVNGILNCAAAWLLFHGRGQVPISGPVGLLRDSVGETFLVAALSYMAAALISRHRRRAGTLPETNTMHSRTPANLYLWSLIVGVFFTCVLVPLNALLLPRLFPGGVSLADVVLFKTLFGAILGALVTWLAISRALNEVHSPVSA